MEGNIVLNDLATQQDYRVLQQLSVGKRFVFEFGSFIGGSALAMLPQIKETDGQLICIDHFLGNEGDPNTKEVPGEILVGAFLTRIREYRDIVTLIVGHTRQAYLYPQGIADMVFIDASHSYKDVIDDIRIAIHLTKRGGVICGHDYIKHYDECDPSLMSQYSESIDGGFEGVGYGVIRAVHEFFGRPNHEAAVWWVIAK